jgi:hypothetical protein
MASLLGSYLATLSSMSCLACGNTKHTIIVFSEYASSVQPHMPYNVGRACVF